MSSAYPHTLSMHSPLIPMFNPSISLSPFTFLINGSMHSMNSEHDSASPCFTDLNTVSLWDPSKGAQFDPRGPTLLLIRVVFLQVLWFLPTIPAHDLAMINNSKIERVTKMGIKKMVEIHYSTFFVQKAAKWLKLVEKSDFCLFLDAGRHKNFRLAPREGVINDHKLSLAFSLKILPNILLLSSSSFTKVTTTFCSRHHHLL